MPLPKIIVSPNISRINQPITLSAEGDFQEKYAPYKTVWAVDGIELGNALPIIYTPTFEGTKNVTLTVIDCSGLRTIEHQIRVLYCICDATTKITNTIAPSEGFAGKELSFSAEADGAGTTYSWDFGNGTVANMRNANVTYTRAGTYLVRLKAKTTCMEDVREFKVVIKENISSCQNLSHIPFNNIFFNFSNFRLDDIAKAKLDENIVEINAQNCKDYQIILSISKNEREPKSIYEERFNAIASYLETKGISKQQLILNPIFFNNCGDKEYPNQPCKLNRVTLFKLNSLSP